MSNAAKLFDYAELALASYADLRADELTGSDLNRAALIDAQMTSTQAINFAQRHRNIVVQVDNDPTGPHHRRELAVGGRALVSLRRTP